MAIPLEPCTQEACQGTSNDEASLPRSTAGARCCRIRRRAHQLRLTSPIAVFKTSPVGHSSGSRPLSSRCTPTVSPRATLGYFCCFRFSGLVDTNEDGNALVYYYPKQSDVTCK